MLDQQHKKYGKKEYKKYTNPNNNKNNCMYRLLLNHLIISRFSKVVHISSFLFEVSMGQYKNGLVIWCNILAIIRFKRTT